MQRQARNVDAGVHGGHYHPMEDDACNFNFGPQDFDIDAEILSPDAEEDATFLLQPRENQSDARQRQKMGVPPSPSKESRLSMLNMDTHQSKALPKLASPAAEGWGPTMALPTLLGMGQAMQHDQDETADLLDTSVFSMRAQSIVGGLQQDWQPSISPPPPASPTSPEGGVGPGKEMPPSIAKIFPKLPRATVAGEARQNLQYEEEQEREGSTSLSAPKAIPKEGERREASAAVGAPQANLKSYQFPVDDDEDDGGPPPPPPPSTPPPSSKPRKASPLLGRRPLGPALKKSPTHGSAVSNHYYAIIL